MIYNKGNANLQVQITGNSSQFSLNVLSSTITPADSLKMMVTFSPNTAGSYINILTVNSNDPDSSSLSYELEGFALPVGVPNIGISTQSINFGGVV